MLVRPPLPAFISSDITSQHGYGSTSCPWRVQLPTGQRVNITLIDFSTPTAAGGAAAGIASNYTSLDLIIIANSIITASYTTFT